MCHVFSTPFKFINMYISHGSKILLMWLHLAHVKRYLFFYIPREFCWFEILLLMACSRNHFKVISPLWPGALSRWSLPLVDGYTVVMKGWIWSTTILRYGLWQCSVRITSVIACCYSPSTLKLDSLWFQRWEAISPVSSNIRRTLWSTHLLLIGHDLFGLFGPIYPLTIPLSMQKGRYLSPEVTGRQSGYTLDRGHYHANTHT